EAWPFSASSMTMGATGFLWLAVTWWARQTQSSRELQRRRASWTTGTARHLLRPRATPTGRRSTSCNKDWLADLNSGDTQARSGAGALLIVFAVVGPMTSVVATGQAAKDGRVSGAGRTIIEGGTDHTAPVPVTTLVAFHADAQGGDFECLALA